MSSRPERLSRRQLLRLAAGGFGAALLGALRRPDLLAAEPQGLITRVTRPLDAETPVDVFTDWLTPNERFFVRSHFGPPAPEAIAPAAWRLRVGGLVERPLSLSLDDLKRFKRVELAAVLQCSGNGRALYRPRTPGAQWERGAVGNARWAGARLADVLALAGAQPGAAHVELLGADRPVATTVPLFRRSIPVAKALHPDTILAYAMNGEPLPLLHGAPLRLIAPGWMGDACVKWLTEMTLQAQESAGYYMETAYRYPRHEVAPGAVVRPGDMEPVTAMIVKSLIAAPQDGAVVAGREILVQGVAWTGEGRIVRVDVSTDEGRTWQGATLSGPEQPYAWRLWRYAYQPARPGPVAIWSRATDDHGASQPLRSPWNPGGFMWNGIDQVRIEVRA